jgi:2'-5' RNA ligase
VDEARAFRRIWEAFRRTPRLADGRHDTPDWRSRAGPFAVCCVRLQAAALQPALDRLRADLRRFPFVRIHPDGFLHVMLQELGFVCERPARRDEIDPARLEELADAAAGVGRESRPFSLSLGGANAFQDAVFLEVDDGARCARLHRRLREVAGPVGEPRYPYLPHATVAHFTGDAPATGLVEALEPFRRQVFGRQHVGEIEIVTLRNDEPYPPLDSYAVIPLRG